MEINKSLYADFYTRPVPAARPVQNTKNNRKIRYAVAASSAVGVLIPMMMIAKNQKASIFKIGYELKEMLMLGTGSILAGLAGGIVADKGKNKKAKTMEGLYQFIANMLIPTTIVTGLLKAAEKSKINPLISKPIAVAAGLATGLSFGSFIFNRTAGKICKDCPKRNFKFTDMFVHADDVSVALAASKVPIIDKLLPLAFMWCGYQTGVASEVAQ